MLPAHFLGLANTCSLWQIRRMPTFDVTLYFPDCAFNAHERFLEGQLTNPSFSASRVQ